jgi:hypothetical protein
MRRLLRTECHEGGCKRVRLAQRPVCMKEAKPTVQDRAKVVELDPNDASSLRGLGYARFNKGDFKAAASDLPRSLDLKDDIYAMLFRYLA